ncbi:hypothetical protein K466DRAFT_536709 [Polyporus arcularius HHB13444]|uniref:RING-type E3 ubiquitin transferase n=1 Tax=Polyporus arcularius HHB13444 TaxID=1314778 RepID=A0A5C3PWL5_9APHY|nr:hypothetical protein K466DRAFT_536709 [Polyporus arcularius HHB13444]
MFDSSARQPCRYFQQGHCNRGTACKFSHSPRKQGEDPPRTTATAPPACQYYLQGSCQFGDGCHYLHPRCDPRAPIITPPPASGCDRTFPADTSPSPSYGACKYFLQGRCTKGHTCSFWHPKPSSPVVSHDVLDPAQVAVTAHDEDEIADIDETTTVTLAKLNSKVIYGPGARVQAIITAFESHSVVLHNITAVATHAQLIELAEPFGAVKSVIILPARDERLLPSARVEYLDTAHATRAAAGLGKADELRGATARLDLRAAESGRAILRSTKVKLSWFAPSLTAWAHYPTLSKAKEQVARLDGLSFNGTTLRAIFQPPSRNQTSSFSVELKGLPLDASAVHLKTFCRASSVSLGRPSFVVESSLGELRRLLTRFGPLESFDFLEPSQNKNKAKLVAFVQFADADAAQQAVATLQASRQTFLRGSQIFLELVHSIKYMLPSQQFATLRSEIDMLRDTLQTCRLRYHDKDENGLHVEKVYLRAYGADAKALGRLKAELEQLLRGDLVHDATSQVAWHEHFSTAAGSRFLEDEVVTQTGTYVKCDARMRTLHVFGAQAARTAARNRILAMLEQLQAQEHVLELDKEAFTRMLRGGFQELQGALGDKVLLDVINRRLVVRGDETASRIAREAVTNFPGVRSPADAPQLSEDASCPVCLCDITDPLILPCSHTYLAACLAELGQEAGSVSTACGYEIPLEIIRSLLTPGEESRLLEATFLSHIHSRAQEFRYYPTADCQTIYRASTDGTLLRCPSCLARVCSTCHVEFHEGLTCAEFKDNRSGGEDSFQRWRDEHGVKACPGCGAGLEKSGGCNHMKCVHCGTHMCWVCMKTFGDTDSGGGVYAHMRREHGGIGI